MTIPSQKCLPCGGRMKSIGCKLRNTKHIMILLTLINFLNYLDRGIISGAPEEFGLFIKNSLNIPATQECTYLGILASSFIIFYAVFSVLFGHLVHRFHPFRLMGSGLLLWCVAVGICGFARQFNSYPLLLTGRALSGIGEASFQCIATPFIDDYAPEKSKGLWLGFFYSAISIGTASGFAYGALIAQSSLGWQWCFWIEMILMLPFSILCFFTPIELKNTLSEGHIKYESLLDLNLDEEERYNKKGKTSNFYLEVKSVLLNSKFLLISLGIAAYTGSLSALSLFGSVFLLGFNIADTETHASILFGFILVLAGTLGSFFGGTVLDFVVQDCKEDEKYEKIMRIISLSAALGATLALLSCIFVNYPVIFMILLGTGIMFILSTISGGTLVILLSVQPYHRALAISLNLLLFHVLGDIPSPILLGYIKDSLAPHCNSIEKDDRAVLNPDCHKDHDGLLVTLFIPLLWMFNTVLMWLWAWRKGKSSKT